MSGPGSLGVAEILRRIRQTYVGEQKKDLVVVRLLYRPLSFFLSVPPLLLGLGPNQVTFLNFLLVVAACALFAVGVPAATAAGAALFLAIFVMDCVDGDLARYLNQRRYFGKLIDGLVDVLVYLIYIAVAVGNVRQGRSALGETADLLAGAAIALAMTFTSYFRMRLAQLLGEVRRDVPGSGNGRQGHTSLVRRMILALRATYENLGPLGPILLVAALLAGQVTAFLLAYAAGYILFAAAEVGYGLWHYRHLLNVPRPSKKAA